MGVQTPERRTLRLRVSALVMAGFTYDEAVRLVAHVSGLRVGEQKWTEAEVSRLLFLVYLSLRGGLPS